MPRTPLLRTTFALAAALLPGAALAFPDAQPGVDEPVALRVAVIDGMTGKPLEGAAVSARCRSGPVRSLDAVGDDFVLWETGLRRGATAFLSMDTSLPDGRVHEWPRAGDLGPPLCRRARTLRWTDVTWSEARVTVHVLDEDGNPVEGAYVWGQRARDPRSRTGPRQSLLEEGTDEPMYLDTREMGRTSTGADGRCRLRGLPAIPGARWVFQAATEWSAGHSKFQEIAAGEESREIEIRLQPCEEHSAYFVGGSGCGFDGTTTLPAAGASLSVTPQWFDGSPVPGARVQVVVAADVLAGASRGRLRGRLVFTSSADANGVAHFKNLPEGGIEIEVREPGFVPKELEPFELVKGESRTIVVREGPCRDVKVVVRDAAGSPVPGAELTWTKAAGDGIDYLPVDEAGVQRLNIVTGPDGTATLPRVPLQGLYGTARLGDRSAGFAADADTVEVTIRRR